MAKQGSNKMWGGCFTQPTSSILKIINNSIDVDKRLYKEDIRASQVYAEALLESGIINQKECYAIVVGLDQVKEEWENNKFVLVDEDEDIHTANERRLRELIGEPADKLHTGRSRNDQSVTDFKLWLLNNYELIQNEVITTLNVLLKRAKDEIDIIMPGYTHLQRAQPVRWSHFLLSHAWNFQQDIELLQSTIKRASVLPLGSGALSGNPFPINRYKIAEKLGFSTLSMNSMNAVSNRDFVAEFLFWCSLCGTHISRLCEDLIIFSSSEFGFIKISDAYSTGSSLLPQKRNPDGLELARAAAGQFLGVQCGFLATLKSLPSTYNKDLQNDKKMLFESFDNMLQVLSVLNGTIATLTIDKNKCFQALGMDLLAAHLAHWLVKEGMPFRQAHHTTGKVVAMAESKKIPLNELSLEDRTNISEFLAKDLTGVWNFEKAVEEHEIIGGTGKKSVEEQITQLNNYLGKFNI